jgi:hypothetical protein
LSAARDEDARASERIPGRWLFAMRTNAITWALVVTQSWVLSLGSFFRFVTLVSRQNGIRPNRGNFPTNDVKVLPM